MGSIASFFLGVSLTCFGFYFPLKKLERRIEGQEFAMGAVVHALRFNGPHIIPVDEDGK